MALRITTWIDCMRDIIKQTGLSTRMVQNGTTRRVKYGQFLVKLIERDRELFEATFDPSPARRKPITRALVNQHHILRCRHRIAEWLVTTVEPSMQHLIVRRYLQDHRRQHRAAVRDNRKTMTRKERNNDTVDRTVAATRTRVQGLARKQSSEIN